MCGILGYISKTPINNKTFEDSLELMSHRGPDDTGTYYSQQQTYQVAFGHKRLAVIDLSPLGHQPMSIDNGDYTITFNGEIYNYKSIKRDLQKRGVHFRSKSDTEVLLYGYKIFGEDLVKKIEGMFAFVIYDKENQKLFFARDHFGKKPLYYFINKDTIAFASELKSLLSFPQIRSSNIYDQSSIISFLISGYIPSPQTPFNNIHKLEPSSCFTFDLSSWTISTKSMYWRLEDIRIQHKLPVEYKVVDQIGQLLIQAVKKRMIGDVPIGILLSGGIDSSLVASLLSAQGSKVNSYSVIYEDHPKEIKYMNELTNYLGIKTHSSYFRNRDVLTSSEEMLDVLDDLISDPAMIPLYYISKHARKQMTVALTGDGGDELFGGYLKYPVQLIAEKFNFLSPLTSLIQPHTSQLTHLYRLLEGFNLSFAQRQLIYGSGGFLPSEISKLLGTECNMSELFLKAEKYNSSFHQLDSINRTLYLDARMQLPDWYMAKADIASMATALELRSPLLDKELAEYMFSLPGNLKLKFFQSKYLLKKLATRYIPDSIVNRPKKGFVVPLASWMKKELKELTQESVQTTSQFFSSEYPNQLWTEFLQGKPHELKLWRFVVLANFLNKFKIKN